MSSLSRPFSRSVPPSRELLEEATRRAEAIELLARVLSGPQQKQYRVASGSDPSKSYTIDMAGQDAECSCPGFNYRGTCRHVVQLKAAIKEGGPLPDGFTEVER